jgi:hypothetical protein
MLKIKNSERKSLKMIKGTSINDIIDISGGRPKVLLSLNAYFEIK